jgi:hypothetical protein
MRTRGLLCVALVLVACQKSEPVQPPAKPAPETLSVNEAEAIVRALDPPAPPTLRANVDDDLRALQKAGLVRFKPGFKRSIAVTEAGLATGLKVKLHEDRSFDQAFGPIGVDGDLCTSAFHRIATISPRSGGPHPAARVVYEYRNAPRPLHASMTSLATGLSQYVQQNIKNCDPAKPVVRDVLVVRRNDGWRVNRLPVLPERGMNIGTKFEYDRYGRVIGAKTTFTLTAAPSDPDGDAMQVIGWDRLVEFDYDDRKLVPSPRMKPDGLTVTFDRIIRMGQPVGGIAVYKVRDPWEEKEFEFCTDGAGFRC